MVDGGIERCRHFVKSCLSFEKKSFFKESILFCFKSSLKFWCYLAFVVLNSYHRGLQNIFNLNFDCFPKNVKWHNFLFDLFRIGYFSVTEEKVEQSKDVLQILDLISGNFCRSISDSNMLKKTWEEKLNWNIGSQNVKTIHIW